jgi:hypothetical protein
MRRAFAPPEEEGRTMTKRVTQRACVLAVWESMCDCIMKLSRFKHPPVHIKQMVLRCLRRQLVRNRGESSFAQLLHLQLFAERFKKEAKAKVMRIRRNAHKGNKLM